MVSTAQHRPPTPERFFNAINAYQQTEAMRAAVELEVFTAIAEGSVRLRRWRSGAMLLNAASGSCATS
jgi:hypothetical protein